MFAPVKRTKGHECGKKLAYDEKNIVKISEAKYQYLIYQCKGSNPVIKKGEHVVFYTALPQ